MLYLRSLQTAVPLGLGHSEVLGALSPLHMMGVQHDRTCHILQVSQALTAVSWCQEDITGH